MKGSVADNYLNFEIQYIYSYFSIIWENILKFERFNQEDKLCVISQIKKKILSEKFDCNEIVNENLIIDNKPILENATLFEMVLNLAMEFNDYATNVRVDANFPEIIAKIKNKLKGINYQEIIENLRPIKKDLKKLFLAERKSFINFNKKADDDIFELKFHPICNIDGTISNMLEAELRWTIAEVKGEHRDIISKILSKHNIDDELFLVSLREIDLFLIKSYINKKNVKTIFIDSNEKFLRKKSNIKKMNKILNEKFIRNIVSLKINYAILERCNNIISELKEIGYNFSLNENIDITNNQTNSLINYIFVNYNEFSSDKKLISKIDYCHSKNIKVIVNEVNDDIRAEFCKKNAGDFLKRT